MGTAQNNNNQWVETSGLFTTIMNGQTTLENDLQRRLHTQISDLAPAEALITITRCALSITTIYRKASPAMDILDTTCQRALKRNMPDYNDPASLMQIFQTLHELLNINVSFLKAKDEAATHLLKILSTQTDAHGMIVEELCRMHGIGTTTEGRAFLPHRLEDGDHLPH